MKRPALMVVMTLAGLAQGADVKKDASVKLPPGGVFSEVLLSSTWFDNVSLVGPIGGPNQGYDLAIEAFPGGRPLVIAANIGKDSLGKDPMFGALKSPRLALKADADGHAVAWTFDGKTWKGLWVDAAEPFFCPHVTVTPGAIVKTADLVRLILTTDKHPLLELGSPNRGALQPDRYEELTGALGYALRPGADDASLALGFAWLVDAKHRDLIAAARLLRESWGVALQPWLGKHPELRGKLEPLRALDDDGFFKALETTPAAPAPVSPPTGSTSAPTTACQAGTLPAGVPSTPLTPGAVWERMIFPERVSATSCASYREFRDWLKTHPELPVYEPLAKPAPGARRGLVIRMSCAPQLMAQLTSAMGMFRLGSAGQPVLDRWERDFFTCGSARKRDPACVEALRAKQQAAWLAEVEKERRSLCPRWQALVKQARDCLESNATHPDDSLARSEAEQAWAALRGFHTLAEPLMCPATAPDLDDPIDSRP